MEHSTPPGGHLDMTAPQPTARTLDLSAGPVRVRTWGSDGPTVLLVHGLLVNGRLWDGVAPPLAAAGFHVVVPDLPLGAHKGPMRADADLSPHGVARLVDELATTLGLRDVTLVGNDTGGAICQLVAAQQPAWLGGLVLTPVRLARELPAEDVPAAAAARATRPGAARRGDAADAPARGAPHAAAARLAHEARRLGRALGCLGAPLLRRPARPPRRPEDARRDRQRRHAGRRRRRCAASSGPRS